MLKRKIVQCMQKVLWLIEQVKIGVWHCWLKKQFHFSFSEEISSSFPQWLHQSAIQPTVYYGSLFCTSFCPTLVVDLFMMATVMV